MRVRLQFWPLLLLAAATWLASPDPVAGRPYDAVPGTYPVVAAGQFVATKAPVRDGVRATADLPASEHHRNVGGSDGAGLCVYTSAWHAALWQSVAELYGFRDWMRARPGGSYPDKFEKTLNAYCREKGIPIPSYVQHTGGDEDVLKLALKTGRMVCVTYCGVDGPGRYGSGVVGHMVNLVHLDDARACIIDNNFPGTFLWMTRADFLARWRGIKPDGSAFMASDGFRRFPVGGGWAIVLLGPPPAPYPQTPAVQSSAAAGDAVSPAMVGQCPDGRCLLPRPGQRCGPAPAAAGPEPIGTPPSERHEWGQFDSGQWGWRFKRDEPAPVAAAAANDQPATDFPRNGVDAARMNAETSYRHNGERVSKEAFAAALTLADDSDRWNLGVVGDPAFARKVRDDVAALPAPLRAKLHVQAYAPDHWAAAQFKLAAGVTLRRPADGRVGQDVGTVPVADYSAVALMDLLTAGDGPAPKPAPAPSPKPKVPTPDPVIEPNPKPADPPGPPTAPKPDYTWLLAAVAGGFLVWLLKGR